MELKDLFLTPIYLILFYGIAFAIRPKVTNKFTKKYFIPALTLKFVGAIAFGLIFQFYYGGGDTFNYYKQSKVIYEAFLDSPLIGIKLFAHADPLNDTNIYTYTSRIGWYNSDNNYFIVRLSAFFGLFCFQTYSVIALCFASLSFSGLYALFLTLTKIYPRFFKEFTIALFFIPSLFFWGSGLMKDSICLGAIGWAFWGFYRGFISKDKIIKSLIVLAITFYVINIVKTYILLCFLPASVLWIVTENTAKIKSKLLRAMVLPVLIVISLPISYLGISKLTEDDEKYSLDKVAETAATTSNYLERQTLKKAGSGMRTGSEYNIGKLDGTPQSMIAAAPQAIIVSLFRPFLFEVRNPVMLLSALECTWIIFLALSAIFKGGLVKFIKLIRTTPLLTFCIVFSVLFGLGVGLTSGNFGTLVRYRVPLLPFFIAALLMLKSYNDSKRTSSKRQRAFTMAK